MTYRVEKRSLPMAFRYRRRWKIGPFQFGPKLDYERPWVLLRGETPIGFYPTETAAREAIPEAMEIERREGRS